MASSDLSQAYLEAASIPTATPDNLSQIYLEAASIPTSTPGNLSQVYLEVLSQSPPSDNLSQVYLEAVTRPTATPRGLTQVYLEVATPGSVSQLTGLTVELFMFGTWIDISTYVYSRDKAKIGRGRPNETSRIQPQTCALTINNRDGRFSPRNPTGPYYGQIGRNTRIRLSRSANGTVYYRFYGEVPSWPTTYDITGIDVRERIGAAGMMRRLFASNQPLRSALFRAWVIDFFVLAVAYWPCEDGQNSASIASGLPGASAMTLSGQAPPTFASNSSFPGSAPLPLLSASIWTGHIPNHLGIDGNLLRFCMFIPLTGAFDTGVLVRLYTQGTIARLDLQYGAASNGELNMTGYDPFGTVLFTTGYVPITTVPGYTGGFNGLPVIVSMRLELSGPDMDYHLEFLPLLAVAGDLSTSFPLAGGTVSTASLGDGTQVIINPDGHFDDTAIGHIAYEPQQQGLTQLAAPLNANIAETPTSRFTRLCSEQVVAQQVRDVAGSDDTLMGYQPADTFAALIQQPADSSAGLLFEARDQVLTPALVFRTRRSLYNQAAKLTLDHSGHQLSGPLNPVDDDALTRNDVTVQRIGGSSAQQILTSGPLSTQAPPDGVGPYPTNYQLSLFPDSALGNHAGWRLHLGTVDEPRYPQISVNLRHSTFTGSAAMMAAVLSVDIGDRIVITNPPSFLPPDPISLIVQGYSETIGTFEHDIVFNCSPEDPYKVAVLGDAVLGHADTDGSTLATGVNTTAVSLSVATTGAGTGSPLWTTTAGDFPFDINIGGERMTVTNITGSSSPQTFTVTRSVNGVVKSQSAGADVRLWQPMYLSL